MGSNSSLSQSPGFTGIEKSCHERAGKITSFRLVLSDCWILSISNGNGPSIGKIETIHVLFPPSCYMVVHYDIDSLWDPNRDHVALRNEHRSARSNSKTRLPTPDVFFRLLDHWNIPYYILAMYWVSFVLFWKSITIGNKSR